MRTERNRVSSCGSPAANHTGNRDVVFQGANAAAPCSRQGSSTLAERGKLPTPTYKDVFSCFFGNLHMQICNLPGTDPCVPRGERRGMFFIFFLRGQPAHGRGSAVRLGAAGPCERGRASPPSRPRPRPRHSELACPRCPLPAFCFCSLHGYSWPFAVSHEFWNLLGKRDVARKIQERRKAPPDRRSDSIRFSVGVAPLLLRTRASRHSPGGGAWGSHVHPHFTGEDLEPEGESLT